MKRLSIVVVALLVVGVLLSACGGSAGAAKIKVATDATFPPFETVDEATKQVVGFDVDLIKAIGAKAGFEVEIINSGFDSMLAGVGSCQYEAGIAGITITDERKQQMLFSDPYFAAGQLVIVRKDNSDIVGRESLSGKTVGSQIGTTGAIEVGKIAGAKLKTYDEFNQAFQDLMNGQIDAVIADNVLSLGYIGKSPDKLKAVGDVFTGEDYGIAVCNKNAELQTRINKALADIKADGTLDKLVQKWIVAAQ